MTAHRIRSPLEIRQLYLKSCIETSRRTVKGLADAINDVENEYEVRVDSAMAKKHVERSLAGLMRGGYSCGLAHGCDRSSHAKTVGTDSK